MVKLANQPIKNGGQGLRGQHRGPTPSVPEMTNMPGILQRDYNMSILCRFAFIAHHKNHDTVSKKSLVFVQHLTSCFCLLSDCNVFNRHLVQSQDLPGKLNHDIQPGSKSGALARFRSPLEP